MYEADYTPIYPTDEELDILYHHGIKGQKWGIRRYQNKDGTLTAEGKKRYSIEGYLKFSRVLKNIGKKRTWETEHVKFSDVMPKNLFDADGNPVNNDAARKINKTREELYKRYKGKTVVFDDINETWKIY